MVRIVFRRPQELNLELLTYWEGTEFYIGQISKFFQARCVFRGKGY